MSEVATRLDLRPDHWAIVRDILQRHVPDRQVVAFGSRATWTAKDYSDLDLAVMGEESLPLDISSALAEAFSESDLPFKVDIVDWASIDETFRNIIRRDGLNVHIPAKGSDVVNRPDQSSKPNSEWPILTLRDAGVELIDCVHKTPAAQEDGYPYVGIPQMKDGWIDFDSARKISHEDFVEWTKKAKPQQHDVVLSRRTNPGVTAIDRTSTDFALGQNLVLLRADGRQVDPPFLKWLVRTPAWWRQIDKFMNVGAVFNSLKCADVPNFELLVPPIEIQRRLSVLLDDIDGKIELNRRMNETLEAMARAIFKDWFVDFGPTRAKAEGRSPYLAPELWELFPDALDGEGEPVGWQPGTLAALAYSPRRGVSPADIAEDTPYIGLEHMPRRSIALSEWGSAGNVTSNKSIFKRGDLLFGKLRPYFHKVGFAPLDGICSTDIVVVVPRAPEWEAFTLACLSSDEFVDYTDQTSTGTKMPRTSWKTMGQYKICVPSEQVIRAFQGIVRPLLDLVGANIHEARTLAQTRDLLLPKLMSGEIRLGDAEEAVEAVA